MLGMEYNLFSFVWYNVENLFDTRNDPDALDDDFTPEGKNRWTILRLNEKIDRLTNVIQEITQPRMPDVIGFGEVENDEVLMDVIDEFHRRKMGHYSFVHYDSPDERGIDVAVIYNADTFKVEHSHPILVSLPGVENRTRDILYIKGRLSNGEIIHLFAVHFPSRREGSEKSEPRRFFAASELRNAVENVFTEDAGANIVIMGDFNDTPDDHSVSEVIGARKTFDAVEKNQLYNLLYPRAKKGLGTTYHKGWLFFDQIIVSGNMLLSQKFVCRPQDADVFNPRYLLHFNGNHSVNLNRTYGKHYFGGYSDHLPVFLAIKLK